MHAEVITNVRNFSVLPLLSRRTDFYRDYAPFFRLRQGVRDQKRILPYLDEFVVRQIRSISLRDHFVDQSGIDLFFEPQNIGSSEKIVGGLRFGQLAK